MQRWIWRVWHRLRTLVLRDRVEHELEAELAFHIAEETNALMRQGMTPADATAEARRRFGSSAAMSDRIRDHRGRESHIAEDLRIDLQFAWRVMRRSPLFVVVAASTIAIGVAATAAVFSVIDAVLLQSLPYAAYDRLVMVWRENTSTGQDRITLSPADFLEYQSQATSFSTMGAARGFAISISLGATPIAGSALQVTPDLITTLGVTPVLGQALRRSAASEGARVAMITHEFWQRALAGDSTVIGREIGLRSASAGPVGPDGQYVVIGVLPPRAQLPYREADVWIPLAIESERHARVGGLLVFGQLKPGVTLERASDDVAAITRRIAEQFPDDLRGESSWLITLRREDVGDITPTLALLAASVVLLCIIVCANLGNMLLSRLAERRREFSVRRAIGAHRGRLVRQILTESLCFGAIGGLAGVLLAFWLVQAIAAGPVTIPRITEVQLGLPAISAAVVAALAMSFAFGMIPAARLGAQSVGQLTLRGGGSSLGGGLRGTLVALEVAMAFAVLTGAGMVVASARRLEQSRIGYDPSGVLTFRVALAREMYATRDARALFHTTLLERLRTIPGVEEAGAVNTIPQMDADGSVPFVVDGATVDPNASELNARFRVATPGYFSSLGIPVENPSEGLSVDPRVRRTVAISQALREQLFGSGQAVGRRLRILIPGLDTIWLPIVAVVGDVRQWVEAPPNPTMYLLNVEQPGLAYAVRTAGDPLRLASAVRGAVTSIDPEQPIFDMVSMEQRLRRGQGLSFARFRTLLMSAFALVVAILAAVGIYGVVRHAAISRTKEFGIRVALGASRAAIVRMVLAESLRAVAIGLGLGIALALAGGRVVATMLYGVAGVEVIIVACVAALLALVTLSAASGPAWRAADADPLLALRGS